MKKNKHAIWRFIYKLHRYIGLISSIVLIMLAVTGIALNHTEDLKLDSQWIQSKIILDWYGIEPPQNPASFAISNHWLSQLDQKIFFDQTFLIQTNEKLLGAVENDEFIVAALNDSFLLLSLEGELIEQSALNSIEKIGLNPDQHIIIQSGNTIISSDDGLLSWNVTSKENIAWSLPSKAPETITDEIKSNFRSSILPLERVLLDIHSGRFFGSAGVIIVDISGILLIVLAISGCSIWIKHKLRAFLHSRQKSQ